MFIKFYYNNSKLLVENIVENITYKDSARNSKLCFSFCTCSFFIKSFQFYSLFMLCSFLNYILGNDSLPAAGADCTYNGYNNVPLLLSVTYTRVDETTKCDKCIFVENKENKCKVFLKIEYEWFLDYGTEFTYKDSLLNLKEKESDKRRSLVFL